jgi:exodeoxyribonuclease V alpha subunit
MASWLNLRFASLMKKQLGGEEPFYLELMQSAREGHLCLIKKKEPFSLPEASPDDFFPLNPIIRSGERYYLQRNWVYETHICRQLARLNRCLPLTPLSLDLPSLLPAQARAVEYALTHQLTVISGGPGTGKTYTAGHLIRALVSSSDVKRLYKVCLTAPTGKAAQHLQSSILSNDLPVQIRTDTLHRVLGLMPGKSKLFSSSRVDADVIVVDEASMIDVDLWAHLLEAVGPQTKLIVMGDPDQLPPVEAGSIFSDLSDLFGVRLDRCMRTDRKDLLDLSFAIREGSFDEVQEKLRSGLGVFSPVDLEKLYEKLSPPLFDHKPDPLICLAFFQRFKILGALRGGPLGIDHLNEFFLQLYQKTFRKGCFWAAPILISSNDPRIGLYNGSSGVLIGPCQSSFNVREAIAYFPDPLSGELRRFAPSALPHYEWAFCLSIHKSQGSEFDEVFALFPKGSERFGREALYTAATRAKKSLTLAIEPNILKEMLTQRCRKRSGIVERMTRI